MNVRVATSALAGGCGIHVLHGFEHPSSYYSKLKDFHTLLSKGSGFTIVNFVNAPNCKKVYREMLSFYKIVYQSPVRRNSRSGRDGFFVVFDTSKKGNI